MSLAPTFPLRRLENLDEQRYELARARQLARAWAATLPEPRRRDMAALFTRAAIDTYRLQARPHAKLSPPFAQPYGQLDIAVAELARTVGREAAPLPIGEAVYFLTGLYTTLLATRERGALGAFYTPPALATRLLDMAEEQGIDWTKARVLDPASGGGAFLLPAAERNADGDEVVFYRLRFPFTRGVTQARVAERLNGMPALQRETARFWNWLGEPAPPTKRGEGHTWSVTMWTARRCSAMPS